MAVLKGKSIFIQGFKPSNFINYFIHLKKEFGLKFTLILISNYFGVKGALNEFGATIQLSFYCQGGWSSTELLNNRTTSRIPWVIKGIGGILSDVFPIFGYEKGTYLFIYTILGSLSVILLAAFKMEKEYTPSFIPIALFFFINVEASFNDLLLEGKYVDLMKRNPNNKGNVISFNSFLMTIGAIAPTFSVGTLAEIWDARYIFFIYIPFAVQPLIFLLLGCLIEDRASPERNNKIDFEKIKLQGRVLFIALIISINGLVATIVGLLGVQTAAFIYNIIGAIVLSICLFYTLPKAIAKILLYVFLVKSSHINLDGHLDYFYIQDCVEGGPQFGTAFYQSYIGIVSIFAKLIGIWLFQAFLVHYRFRYMFWFPTILRILASFTDIIMINRWNIDIGIPDKVMYLIGGGVVFKVVEMFDGMPMSLMCAKVCPKQIETAMFSVVAGFANYGDTIAGYTGNFLSGLMGVNLDPKIGECNYDNLSLLVFIGHMLTPIITIPLTFILLPNTYANENIADAYFQKSKYYNKDDNDPIVTLEQERAKALS